MVNRITVIYYFDDSTDDFIGFQGVCRQLEELEKKMNRKDFFVFYQPVFDNKEDDGGVGGIIGTSIVVICDSMFTEKVKRHIKIGKSRLAGR